MDDWSKIFRCLDCYDTGFIPDSFSLETGLEQKCKNKIHDMEKGEYKKREILREEFVNKHMALCEVAFTGETSNEGYKSREGRILVELARLELNYSPKTVATDIYIRLQNTFDNIFDYDK